MAWRGHSCVCVCVCVCVRVCARARQSSAVRSQQTLVGVSALWCLPLCHNAAPPSILTLSFSFLCVVSGEKRFVYVFFNFV